MSFQLEDKHKDLRQHHAPAGLKKLQDKCQVSGPAGLSDPCIWSHGSWPLPLAECPG